MAISDEDFIAAWENNACSPIKVARALGLNERTVYAIRNKLACKGVVLTSQKSTSWTVPAEIKKEEPPPKKKEPEIRALPMLGSSRSEMRELLTDENGILEIGAVGDHHLCSKYERLDCAEEYYTEAQNRGISHVLHAGNWIDGEAPFNMHDLKVHGMDAQMRYLARHYPKRDGVQTWAISGADHEGWYARRNGVDVGKYAENAMREAGRTDWHDMGYMESFIRIRHADSGMSSMLCLMHPGGGSAYAISYAPQKIVEGFDGGDKPAVLLIGHYHKASYQLTRNVHACQVGCFQDQTPFMRQKKLSAHLGGCFLRLALDPKTGAVIECAFTFRNYFITDYYNGRWNQHGDVALAARQVSGLSEKPKFRVPAGSKQ
ncbi:MAG TPA: hypothetical protein PK231_05725 [Acidocella sp.]|nr:hypothetical protein [Acidocella sp.]